MIGLEELGCGGVGEGGEDEIGALDAAKNEGTRRERNPQNQRTHPTALQRGGPTRRDLTVGSNRRARIVRGGADDRRRDDHGRGGQEADGEGEDGGGDAIWG